MHQNNINVSQERLRLISRGTIPPADKSSGLYLPIDPNIVIKYPEMISDELKTQLLGTVIFYIGLRL